MSTSDQRLLDVRTTARRLGVSVTTVRRLIKAGHLPALRVGYQVRLRPEALNEWMREQETCRPEHEDAAGQC